MGVVIAEVEPPPSGGVAPAASLLQGFASRLDVEAGEVLDELRMGVRQAGDPVELAAAGHRLFEVDCGGCISDAGVQRCFLGRRGR
jgi:hypothetical protein